MAHAFYHMRLSVDLTSEMTDAEISELRWHLGLGPQPASACELPYRSNLFRRGHAYHPDDPDLVVELTGPEDGGWKLSAWQEPDDDDLERLEPLFVRLAARAITTEIDSQRVPLGTLRFSDESVWAREIVVCQGYVGYPRIEHRPPLRESLPHGDSAATTWDDLAIRLAWTVARMRSGSWMTLSASENRYASFAISDEGTTLAEVSSNFYLRQGYRMTPDAEAVMVELGWQAPANGNWTWNLPRTATTDHYRRLADATIRALRDALHILEPRQLTLESDSSHRGEEVDVSAMGIEPDQPRSRAF